MYAWGCRYYFTPLAGVLFTFPSRYSFTIGCQGVFSLIRWSGRIHAEFHVHRITWDSSRGIKNFAHPALTVFGRPFHVVKARSSSSHIEVPQPRRYKYPRFRLFRFRSPLLTESLSFSFPGVTEMFHFTPFGLVGLSIHPTITGCDTGWVVPFGHPRIKACLRLPGAYRNLLRPSSPLGTKAFTSCT